MGKGKGETNNSYLGAEDDKNPFDGEPGEQKCCCARTCAQIFIIAINLIILIFGAGFTWTAIDAASDEIPMGEPGIFVIVGVSIVCTALLGIVSVFVKKLQKPTFIVLLTSTLFLLWIVLYTLINREAIENDAKLQFHKNWPEFHKNLPEAIVEKFNETGIFCETMTNDCWLEIKEYIHDISHMIAFSVVGLLLVQLLLMLAYASVLSKGKKSFKDGFHALVTSAVVFFDWLVLIFGVIVVAAGIYMIAENEGSSQAPMTIFILALGVFCIILSLFCGEVLRMVSCCRKCSQKCAKKHVLASGLYIILAIGLGLVAVVTLAKEEQISDWVENNFDAVCDEQCADVMAQHIGNALVNSTCDAVNDGSTDCSALTANACYDQALINCDRQSAKNSAITMQLVSKIQTIGWVLILVLMFIFIQILAKCWMWRHEKDYDDEGLAKDGEGTSYGGTGLDNGRSIES